jgi:hypothetical protein
MYKHPDDARVFGQYTFKDERCVYETVYYFVEKGQFEFTSEKKAKTQLKHCDCEMFFQILTLPTRRASILPTKSTS